SRRQRAFRSKIFQPSFSGSFDPVKRLVADVPIKFIVGALAALRIRGSPEPFPFRLNRNGALSFCFDAFSSREPVSTSLENALADRPIHHKTTQSRPGPGAPEPRAAELGRSFCSRKSRRSRRMTAVEMPFFGVDRND